MLTFEKAVPVDVAEAQGRADGCGSGLGGLWWHPWPVAVPGGRACGHALSNAKVVSRARETEHVLEKDQNTL